MKAFKGFNKDLTCGGFQYKVGETYEEEKAELCHAGFHACEKPIDCFQHYCPATSVYHQVELDEVSDERTSSDTKIVAKKIKIGARMDVPMICKLTFDYIKEHCTNEQNAEPGKPATAGEYGAATAGYAGEATAGYAGAATAGYDGAATAGEYGAATAGYDGAATVGEYGAATAGYDGAATAGKYGAATAGEYGAATAGEYGAAAAGYAGAATVGEYGAATAGEYGAATAGYAGAATAGYAGAATSLGRVSVGSKGIASVRSMKPLAKGGLNAILVIAREDICGEIVEHKTYIVDGKNVKADTWYTLKNGELIETKPAN